MFFAIVKHVAALTERFQIAGQVVARIVIEMSGRQHHLGDAMRVTGTAGSMNRRGNGGPAATPGLPFLIPPSAVAQVPDHKTAADWG